MFSIVMPAFNARRTIRRTVNSILAQSFGKFELIIVDDGSTDGTLATLADLDDSRLRYLLRRNGGEAAARNTGVQAAAAQWIAFIDADDIWLPHHLAELDSIRASCPQADLIGTRYLDSDATGDFVVPVERSATIGMISYFECFAASGRPFCISSCAMRRRTWERVGGFKTFIRGPESELIARIALDHPVAASSRSTAVYIHGTGGVIDQRLKHWQRHGIDPPIHSVGDLSSAIDLVVQRTRETSGGKAPAGIDAFVDYYVGSHLRTAYFVEDYTTAARLRHFHRGTLPWRIRLLFPLALLPPQVLRPARRYARWLKRHLRRLIRA